MSTDFVPARSKLEAVSRIAALTSSPPQTLGPGSKERKSVLVNLAAALQLSVDTSARKPDLGAQIANALGVPWDSTCWSGGRTITLDGLNSLLGGAESAIAHQRHTTRRGLFERVVDPQPDFVPARSKLEAVSRIAALTSSPPQTLGPGSKERKSVLVNLAAALQLSVDTSARKPDLGAQIAKALGVPWDSTCWSAGQTITLDGLNVLLLGGAREVARTRGPAAGVFVSAESEAKALLTALSTALPPHLDGESCVTEMQAAGYSQWAQDEWAAFYFEFIGLPTLVNAFGGGPRVFANTRFDYALGHTWDLKAHMAVTGVAPLNDCRSIEFALAAGSGLGFLILTGMVEYDDGSFRAWQRQFREAHGKVPRKRATQPRYQRKSKRGFQPALLEAFYLPDEHALGRAIERGEMAVMSQGVQISGKPRPPKYSLNLVKARMDGLLVGQAIL